MKLSFFTFNLSIQINIKMFSDSPTHLSERDITQQRRITIHHEGVLCIEPPHSNTAKLNSIVNSGLKLEL